MLSGLEWNIAGSIGEAVRLKQAASWIHMPTQRLPSIVTAASRRIEFPSRPGNWAIDRGVVDYQCIDSKVSRGEESTLSKEMMLLRLWVSRMTSSNRGTLPPLSPELPACIAYTHSCCIALSSLPRHVQSADNGFGVKIRRDTCGTTARRLSLQYARILEICWVWVGCRAR